MSQSQYTVHILRNHFKGCWSGQGDDYLDYAGGGGVGGPELGKS